MSNQNTTKALRQIFKKNFDTSTGILEAIFKSHFQETTGIQSGAFVMDSLKIDPQNVDGLNVDGVAVPAQINIAVSNEMFWGSVTIRNYYENGYALIHNPNSAAIVLELKNIIRGTGTITPNTTGIVNVQEMSKFTGSYANKDLTGITNYFITPEIGTGDNMRWITLYESYVEAGGAGSYNLEPTLLKGFNFRLAGSANMKYSGVNNYAYYSDLSNGSSRITGTFYHFYGDGDYPSFFGGEIQQPTNTITASTPPTQTEIVAALGSASIHPDARRIVSVTDSSKFLVFSDGTTWYYSALTAAA